MLLLFPRPFPTLGSYSAQVANQFSKYYRAGRAVTLIVHHGTLAETKIFALEENFYQPLHQ